MPNDRITYFECTYGLINNTAMEEASITGTSIKSFSNPSTLVDDPINYNYMTLEHNYFILDGSLSEFPSTFNTPFFSSTTSDEDGEFSNPVTISVTFSRPQNFYGLTFNFEADYPEEIKIETWDFSGKKETHIVEPDTKLYVAPITAINIVTINIEFTKAFPYRYVKLVGLVFGQELVWGENEINSGDLLLETDMISDKISINTLDLSIIDKNNSYNLANEEGMHLYLQKKQEVYAYEYLNNQQIFLGKYFLDSFSWDTNMVKLNCVSYMGLLDNAQFYEGDIYNGTLAGTLLEQIFDVAGIEDYVIDAETYNTPVYGTIKPGTCRDALREILFVCNSTVNTTGTDGVSIYKTYNYILDTLYRSDKISTKITKNDYIHGVDIEYSNYILDTSSTEEIVKQETYKAGTHTILFTDAYNNILITSGATTITPDVVKKYYVTFTLPADRTITITGNKYNEYKLTTRVTRDYIEAGETNTIESYSTTLCNAQMAAEKAAIILNYLQSRLTLDVQVLASDINLDGRRWVQNPSRGYTDFLTWYISRNLDLTGGFVDTAKLVGFYFEEYGYYYAGSELYAGESVGIV